VPDLKENSRSIKTESLSKTPLLSISPDHKEETFKTTKILNSNISPELTITKRRPQKIKFKIQIQIFLTPLKTQRGDHQKTPNLNSTFLIKKYHNEETIRISKINSKNNLKSRSKSQIKKRNPDLMMESLSKSPLKPELADLKEEPIKITKNFKFNLAPLTADPKEETPKKKNYAIPNQLCPKTNPVLLEEKPKK